MGARKKLVGDNLSIIHKSTSNRVEKVIFSLIVREENQTQQFHCSL